MEKEVEVKDSSFTRGGSATGDKTPGIAKYLIKWKLTLGRQELGKISRRPEAMDKALRYVQGLSKENGFEIYRIVPMEELTRRIRPTAILASTHPTGIAIVKARSVEQAKMMIEEWVAGLSYGGMSVREYLEYEISPLADVLWRGKE